MPWSSNATFLVNVACGDVAAQAIYKPMRGERPLWDFEPGLHRREVAAYLLSEAMGFDLVPPTVLRDGPFGEGSVQWFVDADHRQHYFTIHEARDDLHDTLRGVAAVRPAGQQHRPQERPCADRRRRSHLGHRSRPVLRRRLQAAHRRLGVRWRADRRRR